MLYFIINVEQCPSELRDGLAAVMADYPDRFGSGLPLTFAPDTSLHGLRVIHDEAGMHITYGRKIDAFRALGRLLGEEETSGFTETARFDTLGLMLDCSRNAVPTVTALKFLLRRWALMGINLAMLYTEDTYQAPGEPFFGYLRGGYSPEELRELDDYADALGIEMMPCIQTLGHLDQVLQWPAYQAYADVPGVLLTGHEPTYALLEKLVAAAAAPYRSRRINVGMDETFGLGAGKYRQLYGEKSALEIFNAHVRRVCGICAKQGLRPQMWGDMYFCFASPSGEYYDRDTVIPPEIAGSIPREMELVFWDYYHADVEIYREFIDHYRALGFEPLFNCSAWTHIRPWAALPYAFTTLGAGMTACREKDVREAMISLWCDDGAEVDIVSALPAMQLFTEYGYAEQVEMARVKQNFCGSCAADMDDFIAGSKIDYFAFRTDGTTMFSNHSRWLLHEDLLLGILDPQVEEYDLRSYYGELAEELEAAAEKGGLAQHLRLPAFIARALSLKTHLRRDLRAACLGGDRERLRKLIDGDLAELRQAVDVLWKYHRDLWLAVNKPFGVEVLEGRYGLLRARLESAADRLNAWLTGEITGIPELEQEPKRIYDQPPESLWIPLKRGTTACWMK